MNKETVNNAKGIVFMLIDALSVSILFASVKFLTKDISSSQIVFLYKLITLFIILPYILKDGSRYLRTQKIKLYLIGGTLSTIASLCLMYGMQHVPLANATSLNYLEKVLLSIIGILYFKERYTNIKLISILASFIGAVIVVQPDIFYTKSLLTKFDSNYLYIFISIILWVLYCITVKMLGRTEHTKTQLFYAVLISTIVSFPAALSTWSSEKLNSNHVKILLLISSCYLIRSISSFKAMKHGDLSIVIPFGYSKILFTAMIGALIFNETPSLGSYVGYFIIIASGVALITQKRN